ncbi:MAG TPA: hypothetical protein VFP65_01230 [Anaeromyxobacteraceae bacterium]|nr:hypothetical protein [Anaeromyxobacteraceae bacterium]
MILITVIFLGVVMLTCLAGAAVIPAFDKRPQRGLPAREFLWPRRSRSAR